MTLRHLSLVAAVALALAGCGSRGGVVVVNVTSSGALTDVDHLRVTVKKGTQTSNPVDVLLPSRPVTLPASFDFTLSFDPAQSGTIDVTVSARDAASRELAQGMGQGQVAPGRTTTMALQLGGAATSDLALAGDAATLDATVAMDLSPSLDATPADLAAAPDATSVDLAPSPDAAPTTDL